MGKMVNSELLKACEEYLEISIGCRSPTDLERGEASERWLGIAFGDSEYTPVDMVRAMKYPIKFDGKSKLLYNGIFRGSSNPKLDFLKIEIGIFSILSDNTEIVDGPYIPMLRYEVRAQKDPFLDGKYGYAILRQHALLETIFRMKAGLGQVKWRWALKSVYRGENMITKATFDELVALDDLRNDLAHDWFSYVDIEIEALKEIAKTGLNIISNLLSVELFDTFDSVCSNHPSKRKFSKLEYRELATVSGSANASVKITCDDCEHIFNPQNHWKRCPNCQSYHGYWET